MNAVIVLHAELEAHSRPGVEPSLLGRLPYAKRLELERRDAIARQASLLAIELALRGAARLCGRDVPADVLRFPTGGKPFCVGGPEFSISHTARRVAVALCVGQEVGLDLEDFPGGSVAHGDGLARLGRWTATEAVLKAAGLGVREASGVQLDAGGGTAQQAGIVYYLRPLAIAPDVIAHLATTAPVESLVIERFDPVY